MFGEVLIQRWHWKKSRFERLSPLPESPVLRNRSGSVVVTSELRKGDIQEEQSISRQRNMLVWIIKSQNGAMSVCLQKNKKKTKKKEQKNSASPSGAGVIFEAGSVHRWVGYVSPLSVRQIYKSRSNETKTPFTEPTQESNSSSSYHFFCSSLGSLQKKKKKKKERKKRKKKRLLKCELAGNRKG